MEMGQICKNQRLSVCVPFPCSASYAGVLSVNQLSAITGAEINRGIEPLADSTRKRVSRECPADALLLRFRDRILPIDTEVMLA